MTLMSEEQKGKKTLAEDGEHMALSSPCPDQLWNLRGMHRARTQACWRPPRLQALRAVNSQRGGSPAQAWDLCKVLAYCLILRSIAPALPETCRDLDAF